MNRKKIKVDTRDCAGIVTKNISKKRPSTAGITVDRKDAVPNEWGQPVSPFVSRGYAKNASWVKKFSRHITCTDMRIEIWCLKKFQEE